MSKIIIIMFILAQLAQGYIYKCGEDITVKGGEKHNIKFWVEEGELMKIGAVKPKENIKAYSPNIMGDQKIGVKHPFIEQHISLLNKLSTNNLSKRIGQLPSSHSLTNGVVLPTRGVRVEEKKENYNEIPIKNTNNQETTTAEDPQQLLDEKLKYDQYVGYSLDMNSKADDAILKVIKHKNIYHNTKNNSVLQLNLNKQDKISVNSKKESAETLSKNQVGLISKILNLLDYDKNDQVQELITEPELTPIPSLVITEPAVTHRILESSIEATNDPQIDTATTVGSVSGYNSGDKDLTANNDPLAAVIGGLTGNIKKFNKESVENGIDNTTKNLSTVADQIVQLNSYSSTEVVNDGYESIKTDSTNNQTSPKDHPQKSVNTVNHSDSQFLENKVLLIHNNAPLLYANENIPEKMDQLYKELTENGSDAESIQISLGILKNLNKYLSKNMSQGSNDIVVQEPLQEINATDETPDNENINQINNASIVFNHSHQSVPNKSSIIATEILNRLNNSDDAALAYQQATDTKIAETDPSKLNVIESLRSNIFLTGDSDTDKSNIPIEFITDTTEDPNFGYLSTESNIGITTDIPYTSFNEPESTTNMIELLEGTIQMRFNSVDDSMIEIANNNRVNPSKAIIVNTDLDSHFSSSILKENIETNVQSTTEIMIKNNNQVLSTETMPHEEQHTTMDDLTNELYTGESSINVTHTFKIKPTNNSLIYIQKEKESDHSQPDVKDMLPSQNLKNSSEIAAIGNQNFKNNNLPISIINTVPANFSTLNISVIPIEANVSSYSYASHRNPVISNIGEELFDNIRPLKVDHTTIPKLKEDYISSIPIAGNLSSNVDKIETMTTIDETSIRQLYKPHIDVKPELFEIRNILNQTGKYSDKTQLNLTKPKIDHELLTIIGTYPEEENSSLNKLLHTSEVSDHIAIRPEYSLKDANRISTNLGIIKQPSLHSISQIDEVNITIFKPNITEQSKTIDGLLQQRNELYKSNSDSNSTINEHSILDMDEIGDIDVLSQKNMSVPDTIDDETNPNITLKSATNVHSTQHVNQDNTLRQEITEQSKKNTKDNYEDPNIFKVNMPIELKEPQIITRGIEKSKTDNSKIGNHEQSSNVEIETLNEDNTKENLSDSKIFIEEQERHKNDRLGSQIIPHEIVNFKMLNGIKHNEENVIVIRENGITVSIATSNPNISTAINSNNRIKLTDKILTNNSQSLMNNDKMKPLDISKNSSTAHSQNFSSAADSIVIKVNEAKYPIFMTTTESIPKLIDVKQTSEEKHIASEIKKDIKAEHGKYSDSGPQIIMPHSEIKFSPEVAKNLGISTKLNEDHNNYQNLPVDKIDQQVIVEVIPEKFPAEVVTAVTNNSLEMKKSTSAYTIANLDQNTVNNGSGAPIIVNVIENSFNRASEIDALFKPPLSIPQRGIERPLASEENLFLLNDFIESSEELPTTTEPFLSEVKYEIDPVADITEGFNFSPSLDKKDSVIDLIKDFIFSIPQYSNSKNTEDSSNNFSKDDKFNELYLGNSNFKLQEGPSDFNGELESKNIYPSVDMDNPTFDKEEKNIPDNPTDILQKRTGADMNFDLDWTDIHSRRDESPTYYGGDNPFFIKFPGSPNTVPVFLKYEPVKVKYVPAEKIKKSGIDADLNGESITYSGNLPNYKSHTPNLTYSGEPDPFFIIDSPNLSKNNGTIPLNENKEMFIDMTGKLSIGEESNPIRKLSQKSEILYPGESSDVEAYSSIDTQSLTNLVFEMGAKLATPRTREPNPQYTPFPLTTNPPLTTETKSFEIDHTSPEYGVEENIIPFIANLAASAEYSPVPSINFTEETTTKSYSETLRKSEKKLLANGNVNYPSPQKATLYKANNNKKSHPTRLSTQEDFDVVALANFLHQSQKGWIDNTPLALSTMGSWRGSSWDNVKYATDNEEDSWQPSKDSSPWLKTEKVSQTSYDAFYSPEDIPGMDPALFSYRKNAAAPLRQSRELDVESLKIYINNLPTPLRKAVLSPPPARRSRRHAFLGEQIRCDWNIQSDPNMYLVVTFHNLSAEFSVNCEGAFIEVERENNGFEARWCGNRISMDASRSHVIFAKSSIRITVYDNGGTTKPLPTGFDADVEAIDLRSREEYAALALSNARTHMRRLRLARA